MLSKFKKYRLVGLVEIVKDFYVGGYEFKYWMSKYLGKSFFFVIVFVKGNIFKFCLRIIL